MVIEDESVDREVKSQYSGSDKEKFELIKTIVAMANTRGGVIVIRKLQGIDEGLMDSARLDDLVNRYIQPSIENIISKIDDKKRVEIKIECSSRRPHIFITNGYYKDKKGEKTAFYPGQIYMRHSSKTEPANAEDVHDIIRVLVSSWLGELAKSIGKLSLDFSEAGIPVFLTDAPGALQITPGDINKFYPYTAKMLGEMLGKNQNWVARAIQKLGLKKNILYCQTVLGASGKPVIYKYSSICYEKLRKEIEKNPNFNPYE